MKQLHLTNTATRKKELLVPIVPGAVTMYVCGITPYDYSHIGHGRVYIVFDILFRALRAAGYTVNYIRNITDIDDKILNKIEDSHAHIVEKIHTVIAPYLDDFATQLNKLGCLPPTHEPLVTKSIPEIIDIINHLIQERHAYQIDEDIYFDIATFPTYGSLSRRNLEHLLAGARVTTNNDKKRNPGDFVLWKGNSYNLYWESPWGYGRPGWHIECSAMISKFAPTIDIHGGGADLIFPHHENECAQSEGAFKKKLANIWVHAEFLTINKEKMSKSLGNTIQLRQLFEHHLPMAFKFYVLQHAYSAPLHFSEQDLLAATKAYCKLAELLEPSFVLPRDEFNTTLATQPECAFLNEAFGCILDDLGTAKAIALIFENIPVLKESTLVREATKTFFRDILGITFGDAFKMQYKATHQTSEVERLLAQREQARQEKDWARADELRDQLAKHGVTVNDKKL